MYSKEHKKYLRKIKINKVLIHITQIFILISFILSKIKYVNQLIKL